jgi:hypothetical protein
VGCDVAIGRLSRPIAVRNKGLAIGPADRSKDGVDQRPYSPGRKRYAGAVVISSEYESEKCSPARSQAGDGRDLCQLKPFRRLRNGFSTAS